MKTIKYLNIAASVLMLAACAKEELVPSEELIPVSESTTVTFVASDGTKTVLGGDLKTTSWDKKENVLLWEGETETPLTIGEDNKSYEDGILTITADVTSPESTFYSVIGPEGEDNVTRTSAAVLATQNPAQASFDPNAEILVAQPATCGEGNTVALRYNRPVAITVATLKNLEEGEKVLSVKITADENLTGKVNFTYEGSSVKAAMDGTGNTITCNYTTNNTVVQGNEGEGYIFPVYFISLKAEVMVFEFEVCTDKHKYYRKITRPEDSPIVLNDNRVATFGFKLENADKADAEGDKFVKVTSTDELTDGDYLIVYETGNVALDGALIVDQAENTVSVTISNNEITATDAISAAVVTYYSSNGSLLGSGGKYVGHTGSKNTLDYSDSALENVITFDENGNAIITAGNYVMKFNNTSGQERFRYYTSGQQPVQLYKKAAGGYGKYTLATPAKIQYSAETQKITWDAVENAGKYTISLNGGESVECPSNEYDASTLAAEYYYATVVAYPSAEKESTYQASSAGTNEGWFKIGEPTMKKIEAKDIDVLAGARSLEITWPEQTLATNGYSSELWSVGEDREKLQEKTEIAPDATSITYDKLEPYTKYRIYLTVKGVTLNGDRGERVYGDCTTYKDPSTAQLFTIAEITKAGSYAIENAVVVAKANDGFLVKDNIDEDAGYIMVNKAADDLIVGDIVSVSGTVESSNSQLRFGGLSNYSKTGHNDSFVQPATADKYTGVFEYLKYVNIIGEMTSSSGWLVTDATGNKLKVFANDKTDANKYVSVTGYLTHTTASFAYLIATEIVEHTLTATPEELTWEASETDAESVTIEAKDGETVAEWTYSPMSADGWQISTNDSGLQIAPTANTSIDKKELTIKVTHKTNTQLTKEIKLSQNGKEVSYAKVTNVSELSDGDVIVLVYESGNKAAGPMGSNVYFTSVEATINNGVLTSSEAIPITLGKGGNNWTLTTSEGTIGAIKAKELSTSSGTTTWTISIADNGDATITSTTDGYGSFLYNVSSPRFLNYASNPTATMCRPQIYKLQKTITSIVVSGTPTKTIYEAGDAFVPAGLTVTAHYDDGTSNTVSSDVNWNVTPSSMTKGLTSVSVTATYKGVTSAQYVVNGLTVNERQQYTVTLGDDSTELPADDNGDVTLPTRTATTSGRSFVGWSTENLTEATKTSPSIIPAGTYRPVSDITLYPVYKYTVSEGSGSASYNVTTTLTAGKKYIFGAVKAAASTTLANNTTFGAVAFTNTFDDKSNNWGKMVDLSPDEFGKIAATNSSITDVCIWTLESITSGNHAFKNKDGKYLYLGEKAGSTSNGAQSGTSTTAKCYLENVSSTCKDAFLLHPTSTSTNIMLYNINSKGYRMYAPRSYSATMSPYFRFYEYTAGTVDVDYYTSTK